MDTVEKNYEWYVARLSVVMSEAQTHQRFDVSMTIYLRGDVTGNILLENAVDFLCREQLKMTTWGYKALRLVITKIYKVSMSEVCSKKRLQEEPFILLYPPR